MKDTMPETPLHVMEGCGGGGPIQWSTWSLRDWAGFVVMMACVAGFFAGMVWLIWRLMP